MKKLTSIIVLVELMTAAAALAAQPKTQPALKCQDPIEAARQLLLEPQSNGQVAITYFDGESKATWNSQAELVQNSPLAKVYRYGSDSVVGSPSEVLVSLHHLATANPFCGRAGCDPVPLPTPIPSPHPTSAPAPIPAPPHGPHRHAPLSDFGISAEIKLPDSSGQSVILDCQGTSHESP